jgi:hypothetical protein
MRAEGSSAAAEGGVPGEATDPAVRPWLGFGAALEGVDEVRAARFFHEVAETLRGCHEGIERVSA